MKFLNRVSSHRWNLKCFEMEKKIVACFFLTTTSETSKPVAFVWRLFFSFIGKKFFCRCRFFPLRLLIAHEDVLVEIYINFALGVVRFSPRKVGKSQKDIFNHVHTINIYFFSTFAFRNKNVLSGTLNVLWFNGRGGIHGESFKSHKYRECLVKMLKLSSCNFQYKFFFLFAFYSRHFLSLSPFVLY
jgi:hypothetical protein